jgi:hypothetical protein
VTHCLGMQVSLGAAQDDEASIPELDNNDSNYHDLDDDKVFEDSYFDTPPHIEDQSPNLDLHTHPLELASPQSPLPGSHGGLRHSTTPDSPEKGDGILVHNIQHPPGSQAGSSAGGSQEYHCQIAIRASRGQVDTSNLLPPTTDDENKLVEDLLYDALLDVSRAQNPNLKIKTDEPAQAVTKMIVWGQTAADRNIVRVGAKKLMVRKPSLGHTLCNSFEKD